MGSLSLETVSDLLESDAARACCVPPYHIPQYLLHKHCLEAGTVGLICACVREGVGEMPTSLHVKVSLHGKAFPFNA